jgi:hypothetical protein
MLSHWLGGAYIITRTVGCGPISSPAPCCQLGAIRFSPPQPQPSVAGRTFPLTFHLKIHRFPARLVLQAGCNRDMGLLRYGCRISSPVTARAKGCAFRGLPGFGLAAPGEFEMCLRMAGRFDKLADGRCRCSALVSRLEVCWAALAVRFQGHHSSSQAVLIF